MANWKIGSKTYTIDMQYMLHDREYLREHKDEITKEQWNYWTIYGHGKEKDFHEFADYVNWTLIVSCYQLSERFIREHLDYIDKDLLFECEKFHLKKNFRRELGYE